MNRFGADSALIALEKFNSGAIDRRSLLTALGALGLVVAVRPSPANAAASEVVICNWGGAAIDAFQEAYGKPFTAKSGIPVVIDGAGPVIGAIRAMCGIREGDLGRHRRRHGRRGGARKGRLRHADRLFDRRQDQGARGVRGGVRCRELHLLQRPRLQRQVRGRHAAGELGRFLRHGQVPGQADHVQVDPGPLETALVADGVAVADLYPLDVDRAFAKIKPLLPDLIFWEAARRASSSSATARWSWATSGTPGQPASQENPDFTWTWNENVLSASAWSVPKGNPAGATVFEFINSSLDPEGQITLLRLMGNGRPTRRRSR